MVWESYKLDPYVQRFAEQVFNFHEKVEDLLDVDDRISNEVRSLDTCQYNYQTFADVIGKIRDYLCFPCPIFVNTSLVLFLI